MFDLLVVLSDLRANPPEFNKIWSRFEIFLSFHEMSRKGPVWHISEKLFGVLGLRIEIFYSELFCND